VTAAYVSRTIFIFLSRSIFCSSKQAPVLRNYSDYALLLKRGGFVDIGGHDTMGSWWSYGIMSFFVSKLVPTPFVGCAAMSFFFMTGTMQRCSKAIRLAETYHCPVGALNSAWSLWLIIANLLKTKRVLLEATSCGKRICVG
jgi:hypothetical protein